MKQPVIVGVTPLYDIQRDSLWMVPGYMDGIVDAGGLPIMLPLTADQQQLEQLIDRIDGVLFTGGQDVDPAVYHAEMLPSCGEICPARDAMERVLLRLCRERHKPVYGICRGIQFFNAALGGTLYQHLPVELPSEVEHHMQAPYDCAVHTVSIKKNSLLHRILGKESAAVNSYHHQGVKTLAPSLIASAFAPDGLIEAVEDVSQPFFLATQWHPEFFFEKDADSRRIFRAFVQACAEKA
ncbi:MAG: gamma-glutamyl-gamma-aminobutyrate hydrolase family protein [Eubacteriales bacterium]|nr:gamma-glutamyl-gamma-aminobutyrate hydrolase family protein [Eubacteriales bacterium]